MYLRPCFPSEILIINNNYTIILTFTFIVSEYLVGDDVLVAPVVIEGATQKEVVLPPGEWLSSLDSQTYTGPHKLNFTVELHQLLYFTRVTAL